MENKDDDDVDSVSMEKAPVPCNDAKHVEPLSKDYMVQFNNH
jgi:hypothetical protein